MTKKLQLPNLSIEATAKVLAYSAAIQKIYETLSLVYRDIIAVENTVTKLEDMLLDPEFADALTNFPENHLFTDVLPKIHEVLGKSVPMTNAIDALIDWNRKQNEQLVKKYGESVKQEAPEDGKVLAAPPPKTDPNGNLH